MADIFTIAGENFMADIFDGTTAVPSDWYIGWGTGAGTAAKGDTVLFTEAAETRVVGTMTQPSADINKAVGTITSLSGQTITNAGLFSAISSGTLLIHADHASTAVLTSDKIEYTIQIQWA